MCEILFSSIRVTQNATKFIKLFLCRDYFVQQQQPEVKRHKNVRKEEEEERKKVKQEILSAADWLASTFQMRIYFFLHLKI